MAFENSPAGKGPSTRHPDYIKWKNHYWDDMKYILSGARAVKQARQRFLPMPNPEDDSERNRKRYADYVKRAVFFPITKRTAEGYLGLVYYKEPEMELPRVYEHLQTNADGAGCGLVSQSMQMVWDSLGYGRAGLAVDYTATAAQTELEQGKVEFNYYRFDQIINWREGDTPQGFGLTLVVVEEDYTVQDDGYSTVTKKQQKEWRLIDGRLAVKIWRNGSREPVAIHWPTKHNEEPFDYIPFVFHGPRFNSTTMQEPPMADLAELNIGHYRNSADHEESTFVVGQPTYYVTGLTQHWVDTNMQGKFEVGSRQLVPLPTGGDAGIIQPDSNSMASKGMEVKENQMSALGAKNLSNAVVERSASEAGTDHIVDNSVLGFVIRNVNQAYRDAFRFAADYTGVELSEEEVFELNTDYEARHLTPQQQQQMVANWQAGLLSREEVRHNFRRAGLAYQEDGEALQSVEKDKDLRVGQKDGNAPAPSGNSPGEVEKFA